MDRETRKANLKKLQLPSSTGTKTQQRKTRQTAKTTLNTNTVISNYFLTPEKLKDKDLLKQTEEQNEKNIKKVTPNYSEPSKSLEVPNKSSTETIKPPEETPKSSNSPSKTAKTRTRAKRTKLDAFIFKDPNDIPESIKQAKKSLNDDDIIVPEKKAKRAPKLASTSSQAKSTKSSRSKKQSTIKSAFLRNEQLFAEIAAQHCAADQFDGDDIQLALVISKSEAESKNLNDNDGEEVVNVEEGNSGADSIREKLKKYGFKTAEKKDYSTFAAAFLPKANGRKGKSKWANKFTALTLRRPENQLKKLDENIEKLLNSQFRTKPLDQHETFLPPYKLQSSLLKKLNMHENKTILQNEDNANQTDDLFFVSELFEISKLPVGHLLKDWNAIQGRDLTPTTKSSINTEKLQKLQNIYKDLEEYFSSRRKLEWSADESSREMIQEEDNKEENQVLNRKTKKESENTEEDSLKQPQVNSSNSLEDTTAEENVELDDMINLIEDMQRNQTSGENSKDMETEIQNTHAMSTEGMQKNPLESSEIESAPLCDNKILRLLPDTKSLDAMQVSSCSINTQATINSTQQPRSNSPDLFADSDVEMEEDDKVEDNDKTEEPAVINVSKDRSRNSSMEDIQNSGVTTYEIYSSDEVKNLSSSQQNKSSLKDPPPAFSEENVIDLTQDDPAEISQHNQTKNILNQSKPLIEIDIFADSPTQEDEEDLDLADINSNSQISKYIKEINEDTFKFTLSPEIKDNAEISKEKEKSLKISENKNGDKKLKKNSNEKSFQFSLSSDSQDNGDSCGGRHMEEPTLLLSLNKQMDKRDVREEESFKFSLSSEKQANINFRERKKDDSPKLSKSLGLQSKDENLADLYSEESFVFSLSSETQDESEHFEEKKTEESIHLSLSPMSQDKEECLGLEKQEESFQLSLSFQTQQQLKKAKKQKGKEEEEDDDIVLQEIVMDQTHTSFLDFQGDKQLETVFHKETALEEKGIFKANSTLDNKKQIISFKKPEETLQFNLSPRNQVKEESIIGTKKEESFQLSFSLQNQEKLKKSNAQNESWEEKADESISFKKKEESFQFNLSPGTQFREECIKAKKNEKSFQLPQSPQTKQQYRKTKKQKETKEEEDEDDLVVREIAKNQTHTSFFDFQGNKPLETSTKEKELIRDNETLNDTMFRELCNKYLNEPTTTKSTRHLNKKQKIDMEKSFTQTLLPIQTPTKCENFTNFTMNFDMTVDTTSLKRRSTSFTAKTPEKLKNEILSKSQSFHDSKTDLSIDLTQNEDDNENEGGDDLVLEVEEEDDCLVLSDDEINYSIWQANKTDNFQTSEHSDPEEDDDVISITDQQYASNNKVENLSKEKSILDFPSIDENTKEYSYMNLSHAKKKLSVPAEVSFSEFDTKTTSSNDLKFDRSDFGILEEYSEPLDYNTPTLGTPTTALMEASFLSSPSETAAPMKRFSSHRSSQKFQDLIKNVSSNNVSSPSYVPVNYLDDDFDEFDRLVYTSPLKTLNSPKKSQGLEQLMTAEISFHESQNSPKGKTTKQSFKDLEKPTQTIPYTSYETEQEITCNNNTYIVRYTNSPKPDYTKYSEAELLKQLYNFGIKPLKRKQAVKMLEYIYNQTHPILIEDDANEKPLEGVVVRQEDFESPCTSKEALKVWENSLTKNRKNVVNTPNESDKESLNSVLVGDKKLDLQDTCGLEMSRYSLDLKAELEDESYIMQTNVTKKTPQPLLPFHIAWYNLVCSNRKLHETILMYEPIDLQEIFLFLKSLGYRYDPKDLKIFFDRRCIIFRYDLTSAAGGNAKSNNANRHVRKSKKTKVTKK